MKLHNQILFFFMFLILFYHCSIFKKNTSNTHIVTEGSYKIMSRKKSQQNELGKGVIEGYVFDQFTKRPVSYGRVWIVGGDSSMVAIDSLGYFHISLLPQKYKLKLSSVGNKEFTIETIEVEKNITTILKVYLGSDIMYDKK